jgi:hypothetical protein
MSKVKRIYVMMHMIAETCSLRLKKRVTFFTLDIVFDHPSYVNILRKL